MPPSATVLTYLQTETQALQQVLKAFKQQQETLIAGDADGLLSKQFESERAYAMLSELNTKPGVRYLARITHTASNASGHESGGGHH